MFQIIRHHALQRSLPEQDQVRQAFLFDGTYPTQALHATRGQGLPKLAAELLVAVVQQVAATVQISVVLHAGVVRYWLHPACLRVARDAAQIYPTGAYCDEEQDVIRHQPSPGQHLHSD
jgi:hypothetical protein